MAKAKTARKATVRVGESDAPSRIALGSGAPVGLDVGNETVGEAEDSLMSRIQSLQEKYGGGLVERQPIGVRDGRVQYRLVYHMADGAIIPGNGDDNAAALDNLEKRLQAWGAK